MPASKPSRKTTKTSLPALLAKVRAKALARQATFTSAVWKDPSGRNVECAKIHEIESDFLDRARSAGVPAVLLAPYGTGKTEGGLAYCLRLISEDQTRRFGIVCDKDEHGVDRAQVLLRYIEAGEDYRALFPEIEVDHGQRGRRTRLYHSGANGGPYLPLQSFVIVTTATVPAGDGPHYYVLTALDTSGNESAYSNQVYLQVDETPPAAPVLRGAVVRP